MKKIINRKIVWAWFLAVLLIQTTAMMAVEGGQLAGTAMKSVSIWTFLLDATIFGLAGIVLLIVGYYIWEAITISYSVKKELVEKQNQAVALVTASFILGMSIVIAASLILIK